MGATLIAAIIAAVRSTAKKVASGVSVFGKGIAALAKKMGLIISLVGTIISLGAKGIVWLSKNFWLLALLIVYFLFQEFRKELTLTFLHTNV